MHFKKMCKYGFVHSQCRCPSPVKTVQLVQCRTPSHRTAAADSKAVEIQHEVDVETLLYRLEIFPREHTMSAEAVVDLEAIGRELRMVLDMETPDSVG